MQFVHHKIRICWLALIVAICSCKDKDESPPLIEFSFPASGTIYHVFDTVSVSFSATDDRQLLSAGVKLVDENFIPIGPSTPVSVSATNGGGTAELIISDKLLPTADYYILATAFDGENETLEFLKIRIIALPKKRRAVYASIGGLNAQIMKIDSLLQNAEVWKLLGQDVLKISSNSLRDQLSVVGNLSTGIVTYNLTTESVLWSDDAFSVSQIQRYTDLLCFNNSVFTSLYDRELRSYSYAGGLTMNELTGNYRPETLFANENYLIVEMFLVGAGAHFIFVYHSVTRALLWQTEVPLDIKAICPLEGDELLIFGNDGNQARVLHYDIGNNGYWEPRLLPEGLVLDAVKMDGPVFAIAHENGLYSYTYAPNYLNLSRPSILFQDIVYDVDNGTILGAAQNILEEVTPNSGQLVNSVILSDSITSIDIHYTR